MDGSPDYPFDTIQRGIDEASNGDTVTVMLGTYYENIVFDVNDVILTSIAPKDPNIVASTIIDGGGNGTVVTLAAGLRPESILRGFTLTNGRNMSMYRRGGGAICVRGGWGPAEAHATIADCVISGNTAYSGGGLSDCDGAITNCTIVYNHSGDDGGGLCYCNATITNSIIWGNTANSFGDQLYVYGGSTPTYSCIQNWTGGGTGNIINNLLFADSNNGDYHLQSEYGRWDPNMLEWVYDPDTSPCIDAGTPYDTTPSDPDDWQNELWPHGKRINMGAYGGTPQASMSPNPIGNIADLDHDGQVGIFDLELLSDDWLYNEYLLDTDLNRNGKVDIADFSVFAQQWLWAEP